MAELVIARDPAGAAAERLAEALVEADLRSGAARLAVSGGSAAAVLQPLLALLPPGLWGRLLLTYADERCVPLADPGSNRGAVRALVPDPGGELPLFLDGEAPEGAVARVTAAIGARFRGGLDALLLGLGEDGHVASLFPGHPALAATGGAVFVPDAPKPPLARISLTLDLVASAPVAVLFATGEGKRAALGRLLRGDPALPAARLPRLIVVTELAGLQGGPA